MIEGASVCRRFGRYPRRAVVVLLSLVGLAQAGEAPRLDQPPTEIRHGLLTGFVRVDQGVGRASEGDGVAWTIFRDRLDLQKQLRPDLVVEASWDLVTVQDDPPDIHPLNYPTFAGSLGPKKSLLSSSTGPTLVVGTFYELRYVYDPFFRFQDERTQHFVDLALIGTWERTRVGAQVSGGVNVSMDQGTANNEVFLGIATVADIGGPVSVLAEYGLTYVVFGGDSLPVPFGNHLDHKVAAGISYSTARVKWALRYVGAFRAYFYDTHLAQLSLTWFFQ